MISIIIRYLVILNAIYIVTSIQSNNTCAPEPTDKRQLICSCSKQLQLRCTFKFDMLLIEKKDLDKTLRPIMYEDVSLERLIDPKDKQDVNIKFSNYRKKNPIAVNMNSNNKNLYLYFPNFGVFNLPYISIMLSRFMYLPSYAFTTDSNERKIESVILELQETYDFGSKKYFSQVFKT